jgi:long-chain acyl-CoA synthetase
VLTKQEKKELAVIRHKVHMMGELLTLKMIIDRMEVYGDRICMVEKRKEEIIQHSVNDFRADVFALGTALLKHGFKGKHLGIIAENSYAWVVTFFAVTCGVGVVVPIDKELDDETISLLLNKADVEGVFFSKMYQKSARYHMEHDGTCPVGVCFNKEYPEENILNYDALVAEGKALVAGGDRSYIDIEVQKYDLAAIVFTSGATGVNKGVMLTHGNFAQNADGVLESIPPEYSSISLLPMNHVYELSCNILTAIYMNATIYINDSLKNFQKNLQLFKPDAMAVVPLVIDTIYNTIWKTAEQTGRTEVLKKGIKMSNALMKVGIDIRPKLFSQIAEKFGGKFPTFSCGGAPSRIEYVKCLCDIGFNIYNGYGLTESSPTVTLNLDVRGNPECAGKAFPKAKFKIHEPDKDGVGEIWIKGENVTQGYYKDEEATRASFEDGWFKTGDYGRVDDKGLLYIVGRKKNLIILDNGKNVFPEEVEAFCMEHIDYIHEVVVFEGEKPINGRPQKIIVGAFQVDPADFPEMSEEELKQKVSDDVTAVNKLLPGYKRINDVFVSTTEFEINSTRKVIRKKVEDRYYESLKNA